MIQAGKGDSNYQWEINEKKDVEKCKKISFFQNNGTEEAGVLRNEKIEMEICLFPLPVFF